MCMQGWLVVGLRCERAVIWEETLLSATKMHYFLDPPGCRGLSPGAPSKLVADSLLHTPTA